MPQSSQDSGEQGVFQIPRDFSAKSAPKKITALEVGQDIPLTQNNPIYDTDGISWGALSLTTLIIIILGIAMVRFMNAQSWREFSIKPGAGKGEGAESPARH